MRSWLGVASYAVLAAGTAAEDLDINAMMGGNALATEDSTGASGSANMGLDVMALMNAGSAAPAPGPAASTPDASMPDDMMAMMNAGGDTSSDPSDFDLSSFMNAGAPVTATPTAAPTKAPTSSPTDAPTMPPSAASAFHISETLEPASNQQTEVGTGGSRICGGISDFSWSTWSEYGSTGIQSTVGTLHPPPPR